MAQNLTQDLASNACWKEAARKSGELIVKHYGQSDTPMIDYLKGAQESEVEVHKAGVGIATVTIVKRHG